MNVLIANRDHAACLEAIEIDITEVDAAIENARDKFNKLMACLGRDRAALVDEKIALHIN